jgi:ADP-heptose:LPS heptosyltransferase
MKKKTTAGPKLLVIRNDKLGDFMLAWPALALLRRNLPQAHIAVLVPSYTASLAEICPSVDQVLVDPKLPGEWRNGRALGRLIRPEGFDAVITLFSRFDTGFGVRLAGIPRRYAPATKLAQFFYDRRIPQRRSRSEKPEYEYNQDLVLAYLADHGSAKPKPVEAPYLSFAPAELKKLKQAFLKQHKITATKKLVFVHWASTLT